MPEHHGLMATEYEQRTTITHRRALTCGNFFALSLILCVLNSLVYCVILLIASRIGVILALFGNVWLNRGFSELNNAVGRNTPDKVGVGKFDNFLSDTIRTVQNSSLPVHLNFSRLL